MAADDMAGYPTREDRIVAEFGDGHDVAGIAFRHGRTVAQVYAVIEREVGPADQSPPGHCPPPSYHPPPGHHAVPPPAAQHSAPPTGPPDFSVDDAIVAEYGAGYNVEWIAWKHGIGVERVYEVVQRIVADGPPSPTGPGPS